MENSVLSEAARERSCHGRQPACGRGLLHSERTGQKTLAQIIGTTRARVSFFMNKFRKLGFISYNGNKPLFADLSNSAQS